MVFDPCSCPRNEVSFGNGGVVWGGLLAAYFEKVSKGATCSHGMPQVRPGILNAGFRTNLSPLHDLARPRGGLGATTPIRRDVKAGTYNPAGTWIGCSKLMYNPFYSIWYECTTY